MLGNVKGLEVKGETRDMAQCAESHGKSKRI